MKHRDVVLKREAKRLVHPKRRYDYRQRTRLERALFDLTCNYCHVALDYELGGLTDPHTCLFETESHIRGWDEARVELVHRAFNCHQTLLSLSPTDPSSRGSESVDVESDRLALARRLMNQLTELSKDMTRDANSAPAHPQG